MERTVRGGCIRSLEDNECGISVQESGGEAAVGKNLRYFSTIAVECTRPWYVVSTPGWERCSR